MTKDILDEARRVLVGVPEGPWSAGVLGRTLHMVWAKDGYIVADCTTHHAKHHENVARDFIIWSRTGVPALIERVAALEAENKRMREAVMAVVEASRAYLPPDSISGDEFIRRVIGATDNPRINPILLEADNVPAH